MPLLPGQPAAEVASAFEPGHSQTFVVFDKEVAARLGQL
jgi:hypothetical protein